MALDISSPLPTPGGDLGTWGTELNTAITEIINEAGKDSDIVSLQSTKADKTNPVLDGTATGTATTTTGEADKLVKVNSSGRVILGGVDDGINKLQITGNAKITGLAGTGNRMVVADASGNLSANVTSDIFMSISGSITTPQSTGISINAGLGSKIIMAYVSTQFSSGLNVTSALIMITCGYNGDNFVATTVGLYGNFATFGVEFSQVSGILHVKPLNQANCAIRFISNK